MKKCFLIAVILILMPISATFGQTNNGLDKFLFAGVRYDNKALITFGSCLPLGGGFYNFSYTDVGTAKSAANVDFAYLFKIKTAFYLGPVAGPGMDWENHGEGDLVAYFVGASGLTTAIAFTSNLGIAAMAKYKFSYEGDNKYVDGWTAGIVFWLKI